MAHVPALERDQLLYEHEPLVEVIARDFWLSVNSRGLEPDDIIQAGLLGLVEAAEAWNPAKHPGSRFRTYARKWIRGEMLRALQDARQLNTGYDLERIAARPPTLPRLIPLFGCPPYTPMSDCPHPVPIPKRHRVVCMRCHGTGFEGHRALARDPRTDPKPEPKPKPYPGPLERHVKLSRRVRRLALYGAKDEPTKAG